MQLNLLTRLGQRVVLSRAEPPSTLPGAWRDSAISQLEALARANERAAARARRRRNLWALGLSAVLLLWALAMWRQASEPPRVPPPLLGVLQVDRPAPAPAAEAAAPVPFVEAPVIELVAHAGVEAPAAAQAIVTDALPVVAAAEDEAAAKARAQWLARRKAQLAQERARADEAAQHQRQLALASQLEAERTLQQQLAEAARDRAAAAERDRRQALLLAQNTRRGVGDLCAAAGGLASEQHCQQRTCWKAEYQGDAVCVRLRELEFARLQRGADH